MHVAILSYGSRGDVQPFAALCAALRAAGHSATLAAPERFAALAAEVGAEFAPLPGDVEQLARELVEHGASPPRTVEAIYRHVIPLAVEVLRRVRAAVRGADLVVHSFLTTLAGHMAARELGVPDVSAQLFPFFAAYDDFPNVALPPPGRNPALNRLSHALAAQIFWQSSRASYVWLRRGRPELGPRRLRWPAPGRATPLLLAYSRHLVPPPDPARAPLARTTGAWQLAAPGYAPPRELAAFLAAGPPPVYIGFGSMASADAAGLSAAAVGALRLSGRRGVLLRGWAGLGAGALPEGVIAIDGAPHSWLFPRVSAVVHHGGAGTTGAGVLTGVPAVVVPFTADQPFWGERLRRAGAGPAPIPVAELSAERLAAAIRAAEAPEVVRRAAELGALARAEGGVAEAVEALEAVAARGRPPAGRR